jgi:hypothetical protein
MILSFSKTFPWGDPTNFVDKIKDGRKIHTIRTERKGNAKWREGMDIHFATGLRTPDYNQFASGVCTGIQEIRIKYAIGLDEPEIHINRTPIPPRLKRQVAENDGFDTFDQFLRWFDEDFEGLLIHWTDRRY